MSEIAELLRRQQAVEAELRRREGLIDVLGLRGHDVVWVESDGRLAWYGRFTAILGLAADEMPATLDAWRERMPPEDRAAYAAALEGSRTTGAAHHLTYRVRTHDGAVAWFEETGGARVRDNDADCRIGAIRDVSEVCRLQTRIRDAKRLLYSCVDATSDVLYVRGGDGCYRFVNRAFAALAGRPFVEIVGRETTDFPPPDLAAKLAAAEATVRATRRETEAIAGCLGSTYLVKVFPIDGADDPALVGAILRDITHRTYLQPK
jgi:PAS domain S-box-containing protein